MAHGAWRAGTLAALALGTVLVLVSSAAAQGSGSRTINQVERDRTAADAEARRLRAEANAARSDVAALNERLVESGRRRAEAEAAVADAEARLAALQLRAAQDGARYRQDRDTFESAVIAAAFASRRVDQRANRVGLFTRAAASPLRARVSQSADAVAEARRLDAAIAEEQRLLTDARQAIDSERADVITLLSQRRALQASLTRDAAEAERRVQRFAREARNLRDLAQRVAARPRNSRPSTGGSDLIPTAWLAPADGRIARGYGVSTAGGPATQGVTLRTRTSAQVVAPASGEVAYAGLFRSYGHVLIINVDGGYALVLTGLGTVRARVGETVLAGQPVGEMSASDTPAPELYVEVRREGRPINPGRWLSSRGLTAERSQERAG